AVPKAASSRIHHEFLAGTTSEFARRRDASRVRPTAAQAGEAGIRETRAHALRAKATRPAPATSCDRQRICHQRKEQAATVRLPALRRGRWPEPVSGRRAVLIPAPYTETD